MGYRTGKALVFTDLCVFRLDQDDPRVDRHRNHARRHAASRSSRCHRLCRDLRMPIAGEVPLPSSDTLAILRNRIDPLGLRRLEFVSAKERGALIAEILAADRAMVERCIAAQQIARRKLRYPMAKPLLDMSAARVFFDGIFTNPRVAHPEGVAVHRDGSIWCGTETGDLLRHGRRRQLGRAHGRHGWLSARHCLRQRRQLFCLRPEACRDLPLGCRDRRTWSASLRPASACRTIRSSTRRGAGSTSPTALARTHRPRHLPLRSQDGRGRSVVRAIRCRFANGMAMAPDGNGLYVVESNAPCVSYVPILADGSAGTQASSSTSVHNVPDGARLRA